MSIQQQHTLEWPPRNVICVGTMVLQSERLLFVRQAKGQSLEGLWSIPWGFVETGESPDVAALRETYEEACITARIDGLLGIQNLHEPGWIGIVFLCWHVNGSPRSDGGAETDRAAYFSLQELEAFDEPFEPWCKWLALRVLSGDCHRVPMMANNPYMPLMAFL